MNRWEGRKICVRFDGTETRVDVRRGKEGDGLTTAELRTLITVLTDALVDRRAFEKDEQMRYLLGKRKRRPSPRQSPSGG